MAAVNFFLIWKKKKHLRRLRPKSLKELGVFKGDLEGVVGEGVMNLDVGVGDFELIGYGDCRIYVATSATNGKDHTESVNGIILRGGYLLIWMLVFEGEIVEELNAVEEDRETRVSHVIERLDLVVEELPQWLEVLQSRHWPQLHVPFWLLYSEILGNKGWLPSSWFSCFCCDIFAFAFALNMLGFESQCFFVISRFE